MLLCKKFYYNLILENIRNTGGQQNFYAFLNKISLFNVIEVADFEYQYHLHNNALVLKIHIFCSNKNDNHLEY